MLLYVVEESGTRRISKLSELPFIPCNNMSLFVTNLWRFSLNIATVK